MVERRDVLYSHSGFEAHGTKSIYECPECSLVYGKRSAAASCCEEADDG